MPDWTAPRAGDGSLAPSTTWNGPVYQPFANGAGIVAVVLGAWRSILIPLTDAVLELPALSETLADAPRLSPSPVSTLSAGTVAGSTPESASSAVQWTVTSPLYQPFVFGLSVA